ncbi:hypothetical protein J7297_00483 [Nakaseomyces glabratus]|nr:hypothetical protein J7297_00483 [Nakaseomyces glabratus]KAH7597375.1 hypothetical protein J7296_00479 [Nakaseomyces glabratus]
MGENVRLPSIRSLLNDDAPYPRSNAMDISNITSGNTTTNTSTTTTNTTGTSASSISTTGTTSTPTAPPINMMKKSKRRSNLPKDTIQILNQWLLDHIHNPYPTQQEKRDLLIKTGLTKIQLSNWFINVRRRKIFNDYYALTSNLPPELLQSMSSQNTPPTPTTTTHTPPVQDDGNPPVTIMSEDEFSKRFVQAPLTRRKKLIDRLEELKKLTNMANNNNN